jgi:ParB family chromosome partitioning protein
MQTEFISIATTALKESKHNPRRTFDRKSLEELERNVREVGILTPLLVRPNGTGESFEVLAGARRFRVATKLKIETIPCRVLRDLTDAQALEVMVIDNLQRTDVHPLEEADGYRELMKAGKYDVNQVAEKIGKSPSYVYQRLKLGELIPAARKAFVNAEITAGHAILIARLNLAAQKQMLEGCLDEWQPFSVRELADQIKREFHTELKDAPWKLDDGALVVAAGACSKCPKREASKEDGALDICGDAACFKGKRTAFIARREAELTSPASGEDGKALTPLRIATGYCNEKGVLDSYNYHRIGAKADRCEFVRKGLVVNAAKPHEIGGAFDVCADARCKKHHASMSRAGNDDVSQKRETAKRKAARAARVATVEAILVKVKSPMPSNVLALLAAKYGQAIKGSSDDECTRALVRMLCGSYDSDFYWETQGHIAALAKIYAVKPAKAKPIAAVKKAKAKPRPRHKKLTRAAIKTGSKKAA